MTDAGKLAEADGEVLYRVPVRVSVAPVQTYAKTISVRAANPKEAASIIRNLTRCGNSVLSDAIDAPGWGAVGGRLGPIRPDRTAYDTYLDEDALDAWVASQESAISSGEQVGTKTEGRSALND